MTGGVRGMICCPNKRRLSGRIHKPAAEAAGMGAAGALKIEAFFFAADDDDIAIQQAVFTGGAEGTDILNLENAPVRPGDGPGLHIAGWVKIG